MLYNLFAMVVVALLVGWLAPKIFNFTASFWVNILIALVGGFLGGLITKLLFGTDLVGEFNLTSILFALVGSLLAIYIYKLIKK